MLGFALATSDYWSSADLKALNAGGLINEDVMRKIFNISRIPLVFQDAIGVGEPASNAYTEWTQDSQASVDTSNAVVDGADASGNNAAGGSRVGNHCQISDKLVEVTERAQASDVIGRANELMYQLAMRQHDLLRDCEAILLLNQASVADDGNTTAGKVGGFPAWLETNALRGTSGADGGFNTSTKVVDAPTAGQSRVLLTDTHLKELIEDVYLSNGDPTILMSVPQLIRRLNAFVLANPTTFAIATPTANVEGAGPGVEQTAQGYISFLKTDFGFLLKLLPNRLQQTYSSGDSSAVSVCDLLLIDPNLVEVAELIGIHAEPLAKLGLADRRMLSRDYTLRVGDEKAHGVVADLLPTGTIAAS